jgi:hypothetical protein
MDYRKARLGKHLRKKWTEQTQGPGSFANPSGYRITNSRNSDTPDANDSFASQYLPSAG